MHRTGRYRRLNLIFGIFPFIATILLSMMREDSPSVQLWLSIVSPPLWRSFVHSLTRLSFRWVSAMPWSFKRC